MAGRESVSLCVGNMCESVCVREPETKYREIETRYRERKRENRI